MRGFKQTILFDSTINNEPKSFNLLIRRICCVTLLIVYHIELLIVKQKFFLLLLKILFVLNILELKLLKFDA